LLALAYISGGCGLWRFCFLFCFVILILLSIHVYKYVFEICFQKRVWELIKLLCGLLD